MTTREFVNVENIPFKLLDENCKIVGFDKTRNIMLRMHAGSFTENVEIHAKTSFTLEGAFLFNYFDYEKLIFDAEIEITNVEHFEDIESVDINEINIEIVYRRKPYTLHIDKQNIKNISLNRITE